MIDIVLVAGFIVLLTPKQRAKRIAPRFLVIILLGVAHALLGWWLGLSGLSHRKNLAQFVVAANLASACLLYAWSIWFARSLKPPSSQPVTSNRWLWATAGFGALIFVQMIVRAFAAGLRAGTIFNTWPLIDGALIPKDLWFFSPWWKNLIENALSVQFTHQLLGYAILLYASILLLVSRLPSFAQPSIQRTTTWLAILIVTQVCLGVATVLSGASPPLAIGHLVTAFAIVGLFAANLADLSMARLRAGEREFSAQRLHSTSSLRS